ncbi:MAG: EpsI family protein [Verrucomicrobiae bacterium]|nr:EpsI family protein [Verrucomicrobiae bacterium]
MFVGVLAMIAGSAGVIAYFQANLKLTPPPVRIENQPMPGVDSASSNKETSRFVVGTNRVYLPEIVDGYMSELLPVERAEYETLPKDTTYGRRIYRAADGFEIVNMVVLMGADRTSIHKPQYCLEGTGWRIDSTEFINIPIDKPMSYNLPATKLTLSGYLVDGQREKRLKRGVFLYWFAAHDKITAEHRSRMWSVAKHRLLTGEVQRWAYIIYFSTCNPGEESATFERMVSFIRESLPQYQTVEDPALGVKKD